jgi:hypothetical protein
MIHKIGVFFRLVWLALSHPEIFGTLGKVRHKKLTYLRWDALLDLNQVVAHIESRKVPGVMIEAGCALGGSAIVITASKQKQRPLFIYDTFEMIPPPGEADGSDAHARYNLIASGASEGIGGSTYYGYLGHLTDRVKNTFMEFRLPLVENSVQLVEGLFQDTLNVETPVALAHLDCDWYDSVRTCLERIVPRLSVGGVLVVDDYFHWSGCRKAVDEYFNGKLKDFDFQYKSRLHIRRIR